MGHAQRKKDELRAEYDYLESRLETGAMLFHMRQEELERREAALREARDLTWLDGTSGTPLEQKRLLRAACSVGRSPHAVRLVERIHGYERWYSKERWQRPRLADWERLASTARQVIAMAGRAEARILERQREEMEAAHRRREQCGCVDPS